MTGSQTDNTPADVPASQDQGKSRKKRRRRGWSGALVGLCAALGGLIAGRLGLLWVWFDVFSQFSAQFAMMAVGFSIGMIVPRFKALTGVVLMALMVTAYGMWPHRLNDIPSGAATPPADATVIKVASYNSFYVNSDLAAQRDEILRLDADVITLIEFSSPKTPILADLRKKYPYVYDGRNEPECLLVIVSKFPLKNGECRGLWKGPPMIRATVDTGKGIFTVLGVHTTRFPHSRSQLKQVNELIHQIEGIPGNIIMMGDFNATPFSRMVQSISASTGLVRRTLLPTWPASAGFPQLAIDHIFTSPAITVLVPQRIGNAAGSDHYPITMTLAVPRN